jgi:hypothetical protein
MASIEERATILVVIPMASMRLLQRWVLVGLLSGGLVRAAEIDFAKEIQPILSEYCYQCHGPSTTGRKGGLRLDVQEGALGAGKSGKTAIVPGRAEQSELVRRLGSSDPEEVMPPPETGKKPTVEQVRLLKRWIQEGGRWGQHWAFVPPKLPPVPKPRHWKSGNPIDAFVLAQLGSGKRLAPPAEPGRLLRRLSLDLTGLPPTPQEIVAFEGRPTPEHYDQEVRRLLGSPRYGERMATDWLDLARFADTHGFQADRYRPVWPWRDWVIGAFNRHLPFDRFVQWQLAGDLLPNPTQEQRLATTFNRLHLQNEEGGIVEEEYRVAYNVDRVNTFGTAFLGMTFECSRCHDHKYDPISQKEFYQLFAFFQNIDESGQSVYFGDIMPVPTLLLSTPEQDAKLKDLNARIRAGETRLGQVAGDARAAFEEWRSKASGPVPEVSGAVARFSFDAMVSNAFPSTVGNHRAQPFEGPGSVEGRWGKALLLSGENGVSMPGIGHFSRADPFSISLWIQPAMHVPRQTVIHHSSAWMDAGSRGYEILLEDGKVAVGLHHMWPGNALKVRTRKPAPFGTWTHVAFAYDGSSRAAGLKVYLDGNEAEVEVVRDNLWKDITYGQPNLTIGQRMRDFGFKQGRVDELQVFDRTLSPVEVAALAGRESAPDEAALFQHFLLTRHAPHREASEALMKLRREQNALVTSIADIMVMEEMAQPKPAHVLRRGMYDQPGDAVTMDTPAVMGRLPAGAPRNRLGLSQWLLDPSHPLMGRVTVNRVWQQFFGKGLVETSDNFGLQGAAPTHRELLDWLAVTFVRGNEALGIRPWSLQDLQRLIVTSDTYRQTSNVKPKEWAADPDNRLLARGPARRLSAEMLRDQALMVSGLMVDKIGGPSVKPYHPDGLWEMTMGGGHYQVGKGDDLHRRSLYTYWKRTVPPPSMMTLDAADRSYCVVRRQATSTPLQALVLLNDPQMVEAARHVAGRTLREAGAGAEQRVRYAFALVTGRRPSKDEVSVLMRLLDEQEAHFQKDTAAAERLLKVGEKPVPGEHPPAQLAAATVMAQLLFNHDEAVMRR